MTSLALILTYLGCVSSGSMLSMLLLLIAAYISAAIWLISNNVIYAGLLYILVYVGAIVVLIMFVVQLTNTSLNTTVQVESNNLTILQNVVLIICLFILFTIAYSFVGNTHDILINLTNLNLDNIIPISDNYNLYYLIYPLHMLASTIFNEYAFVLILSVHAIVLAVIGPIKLALSK